MKEVLLDTDILSYFFKGNPGVVAKAEEYIGKFGVIGISMITYYEIISGLMAKNATKQLEVFKEFTAENKIYPLTEASIQISADLYAHLRKAGTPVDDLDLLIAGIALENKLVLVTNNEKHFARVKELQIENWKNGTAR
jgi:tRNA(fMet)-specific endonuclease VapC